MRLGKRARYSVRLMMGIGKLAEQRRPVSTRDVAKNSGISRRYLEQLTASLKNAALIKGHCGRGGGYTLARPAADITIGQIMAAATGPVRIAECATEPNSCLQAEYCNCRLFYRLLHRQIDSLFNHFTLADLLRDEGADKIQQAMDLLADRPPLPPPARGAWLTNENECPRS